MPTQPWIRWVRNQMKYRLPWDFRKQTRSLTKFAEIGYESCNMPFLLSSLFHRRPCWTAIRGKGEVVVKGKVSRSPALFADLKIKTGPQKKWKQNKFLWEEYCKYFVIWNPAHFGCPRFLYPANFSCPRFLNPANCGCPSFLNSALFAWPCFLPL